MPTDDEITEDDILITALAHGRTHTEAGNVINRSAKTVQRRMADPEFAKRVSSARAQKLDEISGQLTDMAATAISVVREAMAPEQPTRDRLAAAKLTFSQLHEFRSRGDVEDRLREVEALAERLAAALDAATEELE